MKSKVLISILIVLVLSSFMQNIYSDTTGALSPTTANSSVSSINDFTNRNNAFASDNSDARGQGNDDQAYGGFGISIPTYATINGITINLEGDRDECPTSSNPRFRVQLSNPTLVGDPTGLGSFTSTTQTTTNLVAGDSIRTLGSSSDMWGLSYTPTQLNNLWVMITILCSTTNDDIRLDHFTVTVTYTLNVPDAPVLSEVSHTTTSVATSWTIPNNGGSVITSYTLERSTNNFGSTDQSFVIPFGTNFYDNTGLSDNTSYQFRVKTTNVIGDSVYSNIISVTTDTIPPPPDITPPVITILGSNPIDHTINTSYTDAGATALDNVDGDITANIITTNNVDETTLGTYTVDYEVSDLAGNPTTISRTVNVVSVVVLPTTPKGDSCNDCISPTLGVDENNKERVSGGFTYKNGFSAEDFFIPISRDFISQTVNVDYFRTPFPAIGTEVGVNNTLILKIYEDSGINNIRHIAVGFGLDKDKWFSESKAYIEVNRDFRGSITMKTFGAVQNVTYATNIVPCGIVKADCLEFTLYHTFTEDVSGVVGTYIWDNRLNSWQNYFNDGINIKDNKVVIEEPAPVKIDEDKLKGVTSFGYFQRGTYAFENYKQSQADEAKELFNSLYGRINNWD